jgi:predicted nucleotidyltransferase
MTYGFSETQIAAIRGVIAAHSGVQEAIVFGSRAMGRQNTRSDVDIALRGDLEPLEAEILSMELDALPLPVVFDVQILDAISHGPLREHIERVGQTLFRRSAL